MSTYRRSASKSNEQSRSSKLRNSTTSHPHPSILSRQPSDILDSSLNFVENDSALLRKILTRFSHFLRNDRQSLIIQLMKQCDPMDMAFLNKKIPKLHRDFIKLCPSHIVNRIMGYIHPKDFCNVVQVSTVWSKASTDVKLWQMLYARLGLKDMADTYYLPHQPMLVNAQRLYSLGNWEKGVFVLKKFKAHPIGILCLCFNGKWVVVGFFFKFFSS
jgi:hypothetical protein